MAGDEAISSCLTILKKCQEEHESCESQRVPLLPTIVIDLEDPNHPRPCISKENQRDCYVALSYCWGGPQEVQLTKDTIDAKIKGFKLKDLPPIIQDSIQVTGKLRFRYLWIDALCIIQDDREDQNLEIESMGNIYRNSSLTVAASDSKSVQNGFLKSQSQYSTCKLPFYLPNNCMGNIEVAYYTQIATQERWHLSTRAWALQEEFLSPRILFADGETRWQCQSVYNEFWGRVPLILRNGKVFNDFRHPCSRIEMKDVQSRKQFKHQTKIRTSNFGKNSQKYRGVS